MEVAQGPTSVPLHRLLIAFARVGIFSIGGGSSTMLLLQEEFVKRTGWLTPKEFAFTMGLSRATVGVHLLAQAVLIGYRLHGFAGSLVGLAGLLLPSGVITILFAVGFIAASQHPLGNAAIRGVLPATGALMVAVAVRMALDQLKEERGRGRGVVLGLMLTAFGLTLFAQLSSALVVLLAAALGGVLYRTFVEIDRGHR